MEIVSVTLKEHGPTETVVGNGRSAMRVLRLATRVQNIAF
jgi:hypothetical protein